MNKTRAEYLRRVLGKRRNRRLPSAVRALQPEPKRERKPKVEPESEPEVEKPKTIEEKFVLLHAENPHVYKELVRLAREALLSGQRKWSINGLFEVLRWKLVIETNDREFRLSNNHRACYARLIMEQEPDLEGFFTIKRRRFELKDEENCSNLVKETHGC